MASIDFLHNTVNGWEKEKGDSDFERIKYEKRMIKTSLKRRGLKPNFEGEWEAHGPHENMPYEVYCGFAVTITNPKEDCVLGVKKMNPRRGFMLCANRTCKKHEQQFLVTITPHGTYEIEDGDTSSWWKTGPENRIYIDHRKNNETTRILS